MSLSEKQTSDIARPIQWRGFRGKVKERIDPSAIFDIIGTIPLESLPHDKRVEFVKDKPDKGSRVYRAMVDIGSGEEELFIKTFSAGEVFLVMGARMLSRKGFKRPFHYPVKLVKLLFAGGTAERSWKAAEVCQRSGILVAEQLMYLSRGTSLLREELMVSRGVNPRHGANARHYFESDLAPPLSEEKRLLKMTLLKELGKLLRQVRDSQIMFPDFKLHNLVISETADGRPCFVVVDLSEAVIDRPDYPEFVFLERFSVRLPGFSSADKIRLIKAYLEAGNDGRSWEEICDGVQKRAGQRGRL